MKTSLLLASALAAPLCMSPAFADDTASPAFHALKNVSVTALTDHELDAVEGAKRVCVVCINAAKVYQANVSIVSLGVAQLNNVSQSNN